MQLPSSVELALVLALASSFVLVFALAAAAAHNSSLSQFIASPPNPLFIRL
jgi:hypothetical protein